MKTAFAEILNKEVESGWLEKLIEEAKKKSDQ